MPKFPDHAQLANLSLIEELYHSYLVNPESVDISWRHFFEGIDFASYLSKRGPETATAASDPAQNYRRYGHLAARFNPLEVGEKQVPSNLFANNSKLQSIYCNKIGFEFMDLGRQELEKWMIERLESKEAPLLVKEEKQLLLEYLQKAESFEAFLHTKYVGQTRFSLEGAETLIPLLAEIVHEGGNLGVDEILIGMAHRGRLNVLTNILNKPLQTIFEEFEDDTSLSFSGNDDVRYHMGFSGDLTTRSGKKVTVQMAANPSHLESVDPVVLGQTFARQEVKQDSDQNRTVPLLIHGDASIAGQGVVYECLQLMNLPDYSVGGTIHIVINNQIGYTTLPQEGRSTRYCTDIAKAFGCPVFHVSVEDPEECLFVAKLAVEIRQKFHIDVFIDLIGYRKYGHNEGDEPSYTQPLQYRLIRSKKTIRQIYLERLISEGAVDQSWSDSLEGQHKEILKGALEKAVTGKTPPTVSRESEEVTTQIDLATLKKVMAAFGQIPSNFHLHPKLQKWLTDRLASVDGKIDWASGEYLAFGSLLSQKVPIRLAGQDAQRGTFSQRHLVWTDSENGERYSPLKQFGTRVEIVNSPLTEYAGMGFEVGYTWSCKESFVLWEAQYGDFDNGAQIIIDQYLASAGHKWGSPTSLTLLLPHGFEGAGPEHSSARIERFLQLAAQNNMLIAYPTTPAQYFHLLRWQALKSTKRPLIIFTPKSLLRSPACTSIAADFTEKRFEAILEEESQKPIKRLLFCTGKIYYDLLAARKREDVLIIRIEQIYPLDTEKLNKVLEKHKSVKELFWVQEEPENMGAWNYIRPFLPNASYVGRVAHATTATGSNRKHKQEQQSLMEKAFA